LSMKEDGTPERPESLREPYSRFCIKALIAIVLALFLVICLLLVWYTIRALLLIFFSALIAVFLRGVSNWVTSWSRLPARLSLTVVIMILCALAGFSTWMLVPHIIEQTGELAQELPRSVNQAQDFIEKYTGSSIVSLGKGGLTRLFNNTGDLKHLGTFFSSTLVAVADIIIVFFLILYLAYSPELYIKGIVSLVPIRHRPRALEVIQTLGSTLQRWLIGRLSTMTIVGVLSGLGLWLFGVSLALTLGLLAGLLTFIPYVGAIVSAIPAILMALLIDFSHAVYVGLLYVGIHIVEGYILSPLIQERTVYIPPMLMLSALTALTIILGIPGLIIATPLTAIVLVLVKKIYIETILGDSTDIPGKGEYEKKDE
jgi:predicted PurR-regulated permease PerM